MPRRVRARSGRRARDLVLPQRDADAFRRGCATRREAWLLECIRDLGGDICRMRLSGNIFSGREAFPRWQSTHLFPKRGACFRSKKYKRGPGRSPGRISLSKARCSEFLIPFAVVNTLSGLEQDEDNWVSGLVGSAVGERASGMHASSSLATPAQGLAGRRSKRTNVWAPRLHWGLKPGPSARKAGALPMGCGGLHIAVSLGTRALWAPDRSCPGGAESIFEVRSKTDICGI